MRAWLIVILASATLAAQQTAGPQVTSQDLLDGLKDPTRWLSNGGDYSGQRHSPLTQINRDNAGSLVPKWVYRVEGATHLESTPLVYDGVMYVTNSNEVHALDARTGRRIWT